MNRSPSEPIPPSSPASSGRLPRRRGCSYSWIVLRCPEPVYVDRDMWEKIILNLFIVTLPLGKSHLPAEKIVDSGRAASPARAAAPYLEEALRWLPPEGNDGLGMLNDELSAASPRSRYQQAPARQEVSDAKGAHSAFAALPDPTVTGLARPKKRAYSDNGWGAC